MRTFRGRKPISGRAIQAPAWMGFLMRPAAMPIQIKTKKLLPRQSDLADEIKVEMLNQIVKDFAQEARSQLAKLKCEKHPSRVSSITIAAHRTHTLIIKRKFCCPTFEKKISGKLEGYLLE